MKIRMVGVAVVVTAVAGGLWLARQPGRAVSAAEEAFDIIPTSVPVPDATFQGRDGKAISLAGRRGEVLFVNFWATWCPPCLEEMPSMLKLGKELGSAHPGKFRMVAVSEDAGWPEVEEYFRKNFGGVPEGITLALDADARGAQAYYCAARAACPDVKFPESYIVDKSGKLVAYVVNSRDWGDPVARAFLERLIRE
jgi:thiol-disulfide isomerase/thioredoxin